MRMIVTPADRPAAIPPLETLTRRSSLAVEVLDAPSAPAPTTTTPCAPFWSSATRRSPSRLALRLGGKEARLRLLDWESWANRRPNSSGPVHRRPRRPLHTWTSRSRNRALLADLPQGLGRNRSLLATYAAYP